MQPYMDRSESQLVQFDLLTGFTAVYIVTHQEYTRLDWLKGKTPNDDTSNLGKFANTKSL